MPSHRRPYTEESFMKKIMVAGAGKIGSAIAALLAASRDYAVTVADASPAALAGIATGPRVQRLALDLTNPAALRAALAGQYAVLSAAPFHLTTQIAEAAVAQGVHYLDLTEDVASTRRVKELAAAFPSSRPTCAGVLTACTACACAWARCRGIHRMRSTTT
jgi:saccharopine dehydrogenase-like NADP-dependent oxidoreductase